MEKTESVHHKPGIKSASDFLSFRDDPKVHEDRKRNKRWKMEEGRQ